MSFGDRLIELRKEKGFTRESFANYLEISKYTLRNYELSVNEPGSSFLKRISDIFDVSCDYLLCLTDDREKTESYRLKKSEYDMVEKYRFISEYSPNGTNVINTVLNREYDTATQLKNQSDYIKELETSTGNSVESNIDMRLINYYYRVASAGTGQILFDMPPTKRIEIPNIPKYRKADYAIGVNGNSMEPIYHDGDTLLVEMTEELEVGDIGIFRVDNESYVKKLGETELISLNPNFENIPLNESAGCMGKVIGKLPND